MVCFQQFFKLGKVGKYIGKVGKPLADSNLLKQIYCYTFKMRQGDAHPCLVAVPSVNNQKCMLLHSPEYGAAAHLHYYFYGIYYY